MVDQAIQRIRALQPLRRDIVSKGFDDALDVLSGWIPDLRIHEWRTGETCWTWKIPPSWHCDEAWVEAPDGTRVLDLSFHPMQVASYSEPIDRVVEREELLRHVHVHPHVAEAHPFIFHYYDPDWSFCCTAEQKTSLREDRYRVVIRSRLEPGAMKVAEWFLPGRTDRCFVLSTHLCHPTQVNDGLVGVVAALEIMQRLSDRDNRLGYRLLIGPETIGSVAWLSRFEDQIPSMVGGLFVEMLALDQPPVLQRSYFGNTRMDRCLEAVHKGRERGAWTAPWRGAVGNDERQFNAPGVRVPMLSYTRAHPWGHPERPYRVYHSSHDDMRSVDEAALERSIGTMWSMVDAVERDRYPSNLFKGEVFLSGLGIAVDRNRELMLHRSMLKIMDRIDGTNTISDIALDLDLDFDVVDHFVARLEAAGLVRSEAVF